MTQLRAPDPPQCMNSQVQLTDCRKVQACFQAERRKLFSVKAQAIERNNTETNVAKVS